MNHRRAGPGSGSVRGKIPAQSTKLRGEIRTPLPSLDKKKKAVKDSPTQLKNEKNVRESLSRLQLGEENTTTPIPKPEERKKSRADIIAKPMEFAYPCRVCGVVGHWSNLCPYLECVPDNITKVGKGYKIVNYRRGRRAVALVCAYCMKVEQHESEGCPNKSIYYEVRGLPVPPHLGAPTA